MVRPGEIRYVVLEGLPAAGKTETLALLSRFYGDEVRVLPELVKEVVEEEGIDLFADRDRLTRAIVAAVPRRRAEIVSALSEGRLCLEESHLGVHLAYSVALDDRSFVQAYALLGEDALPRPDLFLRLDIPIPVSVRRQKERRTPRFEVGEDVLRRMQGHLLSWHLERDTRLVSLDADREASAFLADLEGILGLTYARKGRSSSVFDVLLLLGRPASGKSEFIDFLSRCPAERRAERFHVGDLRVVDDFPLLWEKFLEDDAWEKLGLPRLYSRRVGSNYVVTNPAVWPFLIDRIAHLVEEPVSRGAGPSRRTTVVEFSRGGPHAYFEALSLLSPGLLRRAAILYVSVSAEESSRRNAARYDPSRGGEVLTHSVPQEEMARTYAEDDWPRLAPAPWGWVAVRGVRVPYVAMHNEPELQDPNLLDRRYNEALDRLQALSHP